jgi:hypothetical protein
MKDKLISGTLINGGANAVINGVIQWFSFKKHDSVPISVDSITNNDFTVLGEAVHLGVMLAMVLTFFAFFSIPKGSRPTFSKKIWLILKHGFFAFGVLTGLAVAWQYSFGTVYVSPFAGVLLVALVAGAVAAVVNYLTLKPYSSS